MDITDHTIIMVDDIIMVDIIEMDITIIMDVDSEVVITITVDTVIITDVVIELVLDDMVIILLDIDVLVDITEAVLVDTIEVVQEEVVQEEVVTDHLDLDLDQEEDKVNNFFCLSSYDERYQPAIISKTFPTIKPPNVPTMYPIIAINTPIGISALE